MASGGRSKITFDEQKLAHYVEKGYSRQRLSELFNVSVGTVDRFLRESGLRRSDKWMRLSDSALDDHIRDAVHEHPDWGAKVMQGYLESIHVKVPRARVRKSLSRVDPEGLDRRKQKLLKSMQNEVAKPNALWHLEGSYNLIRWKLVIHGCIDSYSSIIPFLLCSNNNKSSTVLKGFEQGVNEFGIPLRVRGDKCLQPVDVYSYMLEHKGKGSFVTGENVHNQRIERLWSDMNTTCTQKYSEIFYEMEDNEELNPDDDVDVFCLHYVFIPLINETLQEFRHAWMHHKIKSEKNFSPMQMWNKGLQMWNKGLSLRVQTEKPIQADQDLESSNDSDDNDIDGDTAVHVPPTDLELSDTQYSDLSKSFPIRPDKLANSDDRIACFLAVKEFLTQTISVDMRKTPHHCGGKSADNIEEKEEIMFHSDKGSLIKTEKI